MLLFVPTLFEFGRVRYSPCVRVFPFNSTCSNPQYTLTLYTVLRPQDPQVHFFNCSIIKKWWLYTQQKLPKRKIV